MYNENRQTLNIDSIAELHHVLGIQKPEHPLISVIRIESIPRINYDSVRISFGLFNISLKRNVRNKIRYGQKYYDFDEGMMSMMSPGQIVSFDHREHTEATGWWLFFHPDFIRNYPLGKRIREFGFFSYEVNEALHLSDHEERIIVDLIDHIQREYHSPIDMYSQDVMVSYLDVLLNYTNRFYNRQFITRKTASMDLLVQIDDLLTDYFNGESVQQIGLPTVHYLSGKLNLSPNYLSDMLRKITGQSAQKHIHNKLIEKAKDYLVTSTLSVSEIAYRMGFEHPQSFSKLFKNKTNQSPMDYRNSFH
ncbi:AraC-like DNA-binding protein [Paenibacillus phyllosphaerae]|uniref:AraC-like DNA-binding protein n=1 Tax=Paenibacillus phyllosphaerae TaxID=274593 RepID=A0A7W5B3N0_9BACL|nr:helix-turn-helix transcriptional regulator [Paenibacillus phyllosphaerae]MBB3113723.1 AraC-like DNA-binding protein [Paenibacillus phyllosphaerae]